jgi:hypothetical protein
MGASTFRYRITKKGYCCAYAFVRLNVGPNDTVTRLALKAGCSQRCIKDQRALVRSGESKCEALEGTNDRCLRGLWEELPSQGEKGGK